MLLIEFINYRDSVTAIPFYIQYGYGITPDI